MPKNVKNTTFPGLLELVFPHSCRGCGHIGEPFCECCKKNIISHRANHCPNCKKEKTSGLCPDCRDLPPIYTVAERQGVLGSLIHDYKYYSIRALVKPLAELLDASLPMDLPEDAVIVPLPTATHHVRARGFDHTLLIARRLAKIRGLPVCRVLMRAKNTVQVGSDRSARLAQATSAYALDSRTKISPDTTYILLDDVWTTGASVLAAKDKLEQAGAKNILIALLAYSS